MRAQDIEMLERRMEGSSEKIREWTSAVASGDINRWDAAKHCRNGLSICPACDAEARIYEIGTDKLVCASCGFSS